MRHNKLNYHRRALSSLLKPFVGSQIDKKFPSFFLQIAFSHVTPVRAKRLLCLFTLFVCYAINYRRCSLEIEAEPSQNDFYSRMLTAIDTTGRKWLPFFVGRRSGSNIDADRFTGEEACMAVHCTVQLVFGYILPMTVLHAEEIASRKAFGRRRGFKFPRNLPFLSVGQQIAMVAWYSVVGFQVILMALHFWRMVKY